VPRKDIRLLRFARKDKLITSSRDQSTTMTESLFFQGGNHHKNKGDAPQCIPAVNL